MSKTKIKYICTNCGYDSLKWLGKCPSCEEWNSFTEEIVDRKKTNLRKTESPQVSKLQDPLDGLEHRIHCDINEFDRVLGGGIIPGSVVLIGGDPGIGKSTLVLQAVATINAKVLYVSGEESIRQIKLRAKRLNINSDNIYLLAETDLDVITNAIAKIKPDLIVIDSIQTISKPEFENAPGTITQIRECTSYIMQLAKKDNFSALLIGHVTKEGYIAGPKILEHMVDTVLQFEGDRNHSYRILRAQKNRFGSTNEIGIFEMHDNGLTEVINPSQVFVSDVDSGKTGSVITASIEGSRAVLLEVQALVTPSSFGNPQRVATGFDYRRLSILLAVLEKRCKLRLSSYNVFLNMAGGIRIDEPAVDLAVCASIASSYMDKPLRNNTAAVGEVGLGGEVRGISQIDKRIFEAEKLGFREIMVPKAALPEKQNGKIKLLPVENLPAALDYLFK
jgi:DNA repair protein RadA/Sms